MKAVFGYCGKPFLRWERGEWMETYGWLDTIRHRFPPPVGRRPLGSCDIPDLGLFPSRYPSVKTVTFHAGVANRLGHFAVNLGARLVKAGLLRSMSPYAPAMHRMSDWVERFVSDRSAMFVELSGVGLGGQSLTKCWNLLAYRNHGPQIPCGASVALAQKLAEGEKLPPGAYPCLGLLSVSEYLATLKDLDIHECPP